MNKLIPFALVVMTSAVSAAPSKPSIGEVKLFSLDESGKVVEYSQDSPMDEAVLAVKLSGADGTLPLTFSATEDLSAGYNEVGQKAPPPRKLTFTRKVTLRGGDQWVFLQIRVACFSRAKLTLGKVVKEIDGVFPGSCAG